MKTSVISALLFTALSMSVSSTALAGHKVYSPKSSKGEAALEYRSHFDDDNDVARDGASQHIFEFSYGVSDWWKTAVFLDTRNDPGPGGLDTRFISWENTLVFTKPGQSWLDAGLYVEYKHATDGGVPDKVEAKLLLEKRLENWAHTLNVVFEKELNNNPEPLEFGYAWKSRYELSEAFGFGFQGFGSFGEMKDFAPKSMQKHQWGPSIGGEFEVAEETKIVYDVSYLVGMTQNTPDRTAVFMLELEFEF